MSDSEKKPSRLGVVGAGTSHSRGERTRDVQHEIDEIVKGHRVVLFMKGTPAHPYCGFSARVAAILTEYGIPFHSVDVLQDNEIREGIKEYADWPTIPQVYIGGEFIGGSDILTTMHESGELKGLLVE